MHVVIENVMYCAIMTTHVVMVDVCKDFDMSIFKMESLRNRLRYLDGVKTIKILTGGILLMVTWSKFNFHDLTELRPRKVNYMLLRHRPRHLQPPASKIFIAFQVFTLKNRLYIANCQFRSAVICRHFVC